MLRLPDERYAVATDAARALLAPDGAELVGRQLAEFTDAPAGDAAELLVKGCLDGFQLRRVRTVGTGRRPGDLGVRPARPTGAEPVLALLSQAGAGRAVGQPSRPASSLRRSAGPIGSCCCSR